MKIGIDITPAIQQRAGIGRYARELIRELVQIDPSDRYLMAAASRQPEIDDLMRELPPGAWREVQRLPLNDRMMTAIWQRLRLPIRLERFVGPVDVVHGVDFVVPPSRAPKVVTIHDLTFRTHPASADPALVRYLSAAVPRAIRRADAVIAVSASVARDIAEHYPESRVKLAAIPNGVRLPVENSPDDPDDADGPTILTVGTIEPRKNHLTLLSAIRHVRREHPEARLLIVGRIGWRAEAIASAIERAVADGLAIWDRDASDQQLEAHFRSATVAVYPSHAEGFGLPALEAMARSVPTVLSDIPAHREVAGDAALYAPASDAEAMTDRICDVLDSEALRSQCARHGRVRASQFTWAETARRTRRVYERVAG